MANDNTIPHGKPGVASFESETYGNSGEPRFGDTPSPTLARMVTAGADLDLKLYSVVSLIAGVLALAVSGSAAGAATGTVTFSVAVASAAETVTIGGRVYTFRAAVDEIADEVLAGSTFTESAENLVAAINATAAGSGTTFGSLTTQNTDVRATLSGAVITLHALDAGDEGNGIALAKSGTNIAVSGATLSGGDDDADIKPYGVLAAPVVMLNGETMSVPIYVGGHWNVDALTWDDTFASDEAKMRAFEGSLNPGILVSKPKYNSDNFPA